MTFTEFCEKMLIALYQDSHESNEWLPLKQLQERYGLSADGSWLSRAMNHLTAQRRIEGRELKGAPETVVGRITGSGMAYIEEKYGSKDGVGTILEPTDGKRSNEIDRDLEAVVHVTDDGTKIVIEAPASDRIVTLNHNQIAAAEQPIDAIIDAFAADNGDPEQSGLREQLLGQIKAGRELIRAGTYRAYLLYETLARALGELIKRYKNPTLVALANALLGAVVSQLVQAK